MAESAEHSFISSTFNSILEDFARTRLFTHVETSRKAFDFSCTLARDQSRPLVGQTLWKHSEGIDKDLRHLLLDGDSEVKVYLCRNLLKNKAQVEDALADFRRSKIGADLYKLRVFWLPSDFEAGNPKFERLLHRQMQEEIYDDIILGIVFGRITDEDVTTFLQAPGYPGVNFAILSILSEEGFINFPWLAKKIGVSVTKLRETLPYLLGAGFARSNRMESLPCLTRRGKLFLEIVRRFRAERPGPFSNELLFILRKLQIEPRNLTGGDWAEPPNDNFSSLLYHLSGAEREYGVQLERLNFMWCEKTIQ